MILARQNARKLFQYLLLIIGRKTLRGPPRRKQSACFACVAGADIGAGEQNHTFCSLRACIAECCDYGGWRWVFLEQSPLRIAA